MYKKNVLLLKIVIMDYRMQAVHVSLGPCVCVSCVGGGGGGTHARNQVGVGALIQTPFWGKIFRIYMQIVIVVIFEIAR